jgi:methionyl-tRNA formyltransferase
MRFRGEVVTISAATPVEARGAAGRVLAVSHDGLVVGAGEGALRIDAIQRPGRRALTGEEFARGARLSPGDAFADEVG